MTRHRVYRDDTLVYDFTEGILTPTPTPTPTPVPTPTPIPVGNFLPLRGINMVTGVTYPDIGPPGTSLVHRGALGVIYCAPLPKNASGMHGSGFLQQSDHPGTPTELTVEWAISKVPGDFDWYKSVEAAVIVSSRRGSVPVTYQPAGAVGGAVGTVIRWNLVGSMNEAKVDNVNPWFINVRFLNNVPEGQEVPVSFYHSEQ